MRGEPEKDYKDFEGDELLDKYGNVLNEGKELKVKTFLLPERFSTKKINFRDDNLKFALVLDVSKACGPGDSFRFFRSHNVQREYLTVEECKELIDIGLVHPIMKLRNVPVIPVTQAYLIYGAKLLKNKGEDSFQDSQLFEEDENGHSNNFNLSVSKNVVLPNLKEVLPCDRPGGDWLYKCALKAAEFNLKLRLERDDRLYGVEEVFEKKEVVKEEAVKVEKKRGRKRKSYREAESDDEFDEDDLSQQQKEDGGADSDSEEESENILAEEQPKEKRFRKKNGFYDVHTNVVQLPLNTQIQNFRVESLGLSVADLKSRKYLSLVSSGTNKEDTVEKDKMDVDGEQEKEEAEVKKTDEENFKSDIQFSGLSEEEIQLLKRNQELYNSYKDLKQGDDSKYPLAIMDGQYQGTFAVYGRFGFSGRKKEPFRYPPVHPGMIGPSQPVPAAAVVAASVPSAGRPSSQLKSAQAASRVPPVPINSENLHSLTSSFSKKNQPVDDNDQSPRCLVCNDVLASFKSNEKDRNLLCTRELLFDNAIQCTRCFVYFHFKCLETTPVVEAKLRMYKWECNECKCCTACREYEKKEIGGRGDMLFCEECDRGYHMTCLEPPIDRVPESKFILCLNLGNWTCSVCNRCDSCEKHSNRPLIKKVVKIPDGLDDKGSKLVYLTSICFDCSAVFEEEKYCSVCLKVHGVGVEESESEEEEGRPVRKRGKGKSSSDEILQCVKCEKKIHYPSCDNEAKNYKGPNYMCPVCRIVGDTPFDEYTDKIKEIRSKNRKLVPEVKKDPDGKEIVKLLPLSLDEADEGELRRKRQVLKDMAVKRRGRPRKVREEVDIEDEPDFIPVKESDLIEFKGKVVAIPFMRNLYGWFKWW